MRLDRHGPGRRSLMQQYFMGSMWIGPRSSMYENLQFSPDMCCCTALDVTQCHFFLLDLTQAAPEETRRGPAPKSEPPRRLHITGYQLAHSPQS